MSSFRDDYAALARLLILKFLADDPNGSLPAMMLADALAAQKLKISRDQVTGHLEWLDEQGLVALERSAFSTATITVRGDEVARGIVSVSGVLHPRKL
jgi:DNA-binding transcriptional ArsR family regulator